MVRDYPELLKDEYTASFLKEVNRMNERTIQLLKGDDASSDGNTKEISDGDHDNSSESTNEEKPSTPKETALSLLELIDILMLTDIRPLQYNKDLLATQLISHGITNGNVLSHKNDMIKILEDCGFTPKNRAEFTFSQIEKNFGKQSTGETAVSSTNVPNKNVMPEKADQYGMKVVELTLMAIDTVFEGSKVVNQTELKRIFSQNEIDSVALASMAEDQFASVLQSLETTTFYKNDAVKVHRVIKTLLNAPMENRFDIDIGEAVVYLINEGNVIPEDKRVSLLNVDAVKAAFSEYSAKDLVQAGKRKELTAKIAEMTPLKKGQGGLILNKIKSYIEDSNQVVPDCIIIKDYSNMQEID